MTPIRNVYPKPASPCTCMNVRRASRAVTQFYDDTLKPSGLSVAQMSLLKHLEAAQTVTIGELAKRMRIDRTTLNRNMKSLLEAGFLVVSPGSDTRTRQLSLTGAGRQAVGEAWRLWRQAQQEIGEYLGPADQECLGRLLAKLEALAP